MELSKQLEKRLLEGRVSHALILTGDRRRELADYLAQTYVCEGEKPPCGVCIHCRKVKEGIHPDITIIGEDGDGLKVDALRALRSSAYIRPNEAERKVYIIDQADSMNQSGQNVLLKLLEEGPDYAAFLFLAQNPQTLLPTLRSRCETIRSEGYEVDIAANEDGETLLRLLCEPGCDLELMEFCVMLEKKNREELLLILNQSIDGLVKKIPEQPKRLLPKMDALREVRAACDYNLGVGHGAGWLMATLIDADGE